MVLGSVPERALVAAPDPRRDLERSNVAVDISFPEPIRQLSKSGMHTCALTSSGKALCWGLNSHGQLGFIPLLSTRLPRKLVE